jgi:hypothetical protein
MVVLTYLVRMRKWQEKGTRDGRKICLVEELEKPSEHYKR